jgi:chloramphenicol 3-O-phosphotransferase
MAHVGAEYDLEVDLTDGRVDKAAAKILEAVDNATAL